MIGGGKRDSCSGVQAGEASLWGRAPGSDMLAGDSEDAAVCASLCWQGVGTASRRKSPASATGARPMGIRLTRQNPREILVLLSKHSSYWAFVLQDTTVQAQINYYKNLQKYSILLIL